MVLGCAFMGFPAGGIWFGLFEGGWFCSLSLSLSLFLSLCGGGWGGAEVSVGGGLDYWKPNESMVL